MAHNGFVRNAGLLTIFGSTLGIVINTGELTVLTDTSSIGYLVAQVLLALAYGTVIIGLIGLARSGAIGGSASGAFGLKAALGGQALVIPSQFIQHIDYDLSSALGILAGLILGFGMLLVGVSVIQAQIWSAWRKYIPLFYGLYPLLMVSTYPLLIRIPAFSSDSDQLFAVITLALWVLFGIALFNESDPPRMTTESAFNR
jgi:hypothetical protein